MSAYGANDEHVPWPFCSADKDESTKHDVPVRVTLGRKKEAFKLTGRRMVKGGRRLVKKLQTSAGP